MSLSLASLRSALSLRDLTDPAGGAHAMQLLVDDVLASLRAAWSCEVRVHRASPVVSVADNYDRLHYPEGGAARDARYTRYVCESAVLRTQTSAMVPGILREVAAAPPADLLIACPGLVYRRDCIDRLHVGEPHQMDLWRVRRGALGPAELDEMIRLVVGALLPGWPLRTVATQHPYTTDGVQIDVLADGEWIEVGECGLALPAILAENGHAGASGLAMGLGLDRLLMLRKGVGDIRLLRSSDPRVSSQMLDLLPYREVSSMPAVARDLSLVVDGDAVPEDLGDAVREALGERAALVEAVEVRSETPCADLPPAAIARLGIAPGQKNLLVRVVLRSLERTLTHEECNRLRDEIYAAVHCGKVWHWAAAAAAADQAARR